MKTSVAAGLIATAVSAFAVNASAAAHGLYAGVGTLGINVGYKYGVSERLGIRVGVNSFSYGDKFRDGTIEYKGDLKRCSSNPMRSCA